jgi:xylulokinase
VSIVADVVGIDGEVPEAADASLGAAMLAGVGTGAFPGLEESVARCYRVKHRVHHDADRTRRYDAIFERYQLDRPRSERRRDAGRGGLAGGSNTH